ncbi:Uncharacterised protein [Mycobacteroides abscessus subsp. abscessus]|nr:Uncharacterised protein [Mycobacteroides abscessus subsp. abscessus]
MFSLVFNTTCLALTMYCFYKTAWPSLRDTRRFYEANRAIDPGYTLPLPLSFLWWMGLERLAPKFLRRKGDGEAAQQYLSNYFSDMRAGRS